METPASCYVERIDVQEVIGIPFPRSPRLNDAQQIWIGRMLADEIALVREIGTQLSRAGRRGAAGDHLMHVHAPAANRNGREWDGETAHQSKRCAHRGSRAR